MIIPCIRCQKPLDTPNSSNTDYIIANDLKKTVINREGIPEEVEYTGIICKDCYRPGDFVIWGIHKKKNP